MASKPTESVTLRGSDDWENWTAVFEGKAVAANLWKYINPETDPKPPFKEEPLFPT
jgi:hypothetical protein